MSRLIIAFSFSRRAISLNTYPIDLTLGRTIRGTSRLYRSEIAPVFLLSTAAVCRNSRSTILQNSRMDCSIAGCMQSAETTISLAEISRECTAMCFCHSAKDRSPPGVGSLPTPRLSNRTLGVRSRSKSSISASRRTAAQNCVLSLSPPIGISRGTRSSYGSSGRRRDGGSRLGAAIGGAGH